MVLVHAGVFSDWFVPLAASHTLDGFRVVRVRRAGYGPSTPKGPLTIQDHANHLAALADHMGFERLHLVGHSSGALIALQLASGRPELVQSLILMETAACGPLQGPAFAEVGEKFLGPAMGAFAAGNLDQAFEFFLRGTCGDDYRRVIEQSLGLAGYEAAVQQSLYFFRDEVVAAMQWHFGPLDAARVRQPVLIKEGAEGRKQGVFGKQVTELTLKLLPHAEVALIEGVNHMLPLQNPDAVGQVIADFAHRHPAFTIRLGSH